MMTPQEAASEAIYADELVQAEVQVLSDRRYTSPRARLRDRPLPTSRGSGALPARAPLTDWTPPEDPCPVCDGCGDDGINGIGHSCHVCGGSGVRVPDKGATDD